MLAGTDKSSKEVTKMTKKKRRRGVNRKGFVAIPFETAVNLVTLANDTVLFASLLAAFGEDIYIISIDAYWNLRNITTAEGPLQVGFSHGDLTVSEVSEALSAELTDPDDIIAKERSRRPVRRAGQFPSVSIDEVLNDGKPIRTKIKFSVGDGHVINGYIKNRSGAALTTGANLGITGTIYGRWQR